jgi:predicted nucleotidyltransferase
MTSPATPATINEALLRQMAAEIHAEIPEAEVRLFGSHARGDARPDSDVDLMIIVTDAWYNQHNWFETLGLLCRKLAHHRVSIDLLLYPRSKVEERRHWLSHVIALAHVRGGFSMAAAEARTLLRVARRDLQTAQLLEAAPAPESSWGFHLQQAIEKALKAWILFPESSISLHS